MLSLPFFIFWILLYLAREELSGRQIVLFIGLWAGCLLGSIYLDWPQYTFIIVQSLLDIALILIVFGGDIRIRG